MNDPRVLLVVVSTIALAAFSAWMGRRALKHAHDQETAAWTLQRDYLVADLKESKYQRDVLSETALAYYRQLPKRNLKGQFAER